MKEQLEELLEKLNLEKARAEKFMKISVFQNKNDLFEYHYGRKNAFSLCITELEKNFKSK